MADRSRWFESLSVPRLWRRFAGNDSLGILQANDIGRDRRGRVSLTDDEPTVAELPLREGRTFPPDMPRPGGEYGATGTPIFGGFIAGEDYNPQLDGAKALLVYDEMRRSDAQVNATMRVLKLPLKAASWDIDPPDGSTDPQDQAIADFCASALFDDDAMAHPWGYAMHHILLKLDFGVSILEKVFTVGELGEIRFHRLAPRLPKTIFRWIVDPETGALEAVVQFAPKGGAYQYLTIPAMYAAVFCHEREGDNYFGRSVLRSAYQHWWRKKQLYDLDSVRLDRYGIGIPRAAIDKDHRPTDAELAQIKKILKSLRSHDKGYLIQPWGVVFDILTPAAGGRGGASGGFDSINHHNFMISANILAAFLNDPSASKGSKAHTQTLADIFQDSLQAIADDTGGDILSQLVRPLCDLNFDMTGRKYPVVRASGLDSVDGNDLAVAFQRLGPSMANPRGFVSPDDDLEDWFRDQFNAPPRSAAATATAAPPADGGVEDPNPTGTAASPDTPGAAVSSKPARQTPAASPSGASRLASGAQTTEAKDGQVQKGDTGGNVTVKPAGAAGLVKPASTLAPTTIDLDPTTRGGVGRTNATAATTTYGNGGPRKVPAKKPLTAPWPEGPLGPIKTPPPPGGAMGAPPLGVDNAIGNNDGFPLGLSDDPQPLEGDVLARALNDATAAGWTNDHDSAIQRRYEFANSRRAAAFVAALSQVANKVNHHPDLTVDHEHVTVRFTTRQAGNRLTPRDFGAAAACEKLATWANDLALRGDPVVIDGRSFGRPPTQREEAIFNFREIPDRLDQERDALATRLQAIRKQQLAALVADVVKRDANPKTGAFTDIRPDQTTIPLANDVYLAIRAAQSHVAKYGALQVRMELQKQGAPVTAHGGRVNLAGDVTQKAGAGMQKQISSLVTSARITASRLNQQLLTAVLEAATRIRRGGVQGDDLAQAVTDEVSDAIDAGVARAVGQEVNEAFGVGRQTEATANQDLIGTVVRSALLDGNTCDHCDEMDGTEWDADDSDIVECPDPDCEGRDSCRCVNLYMAKGE